MKKERSRVSAATGAALLLSVSLVLTGNGLLFAADPLPPAGADAVPDLYAPNLAGSGAFSTTTGGAPASAINPAQGGSAKRIVFDAGYLGIGGGKTAPDKDGNTKDGYISSIEAGMMFPTRYGVFGGSMRLIGGEPSLRLVDFPIYSTIGGNVFAAKEVYPGMSVGVGFNFGFRSDGKATAPDETDPSKTIEIEEENERTTLSGDLGFHYNVGSVGPLQNFTWAMVLRGLGKSYYPSPLTLTGGVSFDAVRVEGSNGKKDPFVLNISSDLDFPSLFYFNDEFQDRANMILKLGMNMEIAEFITVSVSWPGASGLNVRELAEKRVDFQPIPSVGLGMNILLPSGGNRIAGGRLPSDGDLKVSGAFKPLYEGVTAIGGGVTWFVGVPDRKPPVIKLTYSEPQYFSPNHDGNSDLLEFPGSITDDNYVVSWVMEIKDETGNVVRVIQNKEHRESSPSVKDFFSRLFAVKAQVDVPPVFDWNGISDEGSPLPDGKYYFTISATDDSNNSATTQSYEAILKNTHPVITITAMSGNQLIFGGGSKETITINMTGSEEDAWKGVIQNAAGEQVRNFDPISGEPHQETWDGKDDSGVMVEDGVYSYHISATDRAGNSASAALNNIILDAQAAGVFLTADTAYIAPKAGQTANLVNFAVHLSRSDGVDHWKLELKDDNGAVHKTFAGESNVPTSIGWNGLDEQGAIIEGPFTPELTVNYTNGNMPTSKATPIIVDVTGPVLNLTYTPEYFSPDNDGVEDELFISLSAEDRSPIADWKLEIRDPESSQVFYLVEGNGNPTPRLIWNGRSNTINKNELAQSATDYPYTFTVSDTLGNISHADGKIGIDVLVVRDGDKLRILIPSIVFRPNFADFNGLPKETVDNNTRIIKRIALVLNKFKDYKVTVEGHANPTTAPGPARDRENPELKRISADRAQAVVNELVKNSVARNRLSSEGVGGDRTVVPWDDKENNWKNRRVEFILIK